MKNLPLDISSVQGTSAVFHYCEVFPPISSNHRVLRTMCKEGDTCILFIENCDFKRIPMWVLPMEGRIVMLKNCHKFLKQKLNFIFNFISSIQINKQKKANLTRKRYIIQHK